mgnify:CR=1 FL=1
MSGAFVSIDIGELKELSAILNHSALSSSDKAELMKSLGNEIVEQSRTRILETQESPDGKKWQDFAVSTRKYLERIGRADSAKLLNREGYLQMSIDVKQYGQWSVIVGSDREYAAVHQWGYEPKNIPARPYLGLSTDNIADLNELAQQWLRERIK